MAKGTFTMADSTDDPIYNGGFVISSPKFRPESEQSRKGSPTSADGQEANPSEAQPPEGEELGEALLRIAKERAAEAEKESSSEDEE